MSNIPWENTQTTEDAIPAVKKARPVVVIGASAGGYEALELLLRTYRGTGLCLVFVQHLGEHQKTSLPELMRRVTSIPIIEAVEGSAIEPNVLYIIPAGHYQMQNRQIVKMTGDHTSSHSIDVFFRSVAEDVGADSIGVILSGMGTDGTKGLRAIKEAGGITFAHDVSAKFDGMPDSAISEGIVDFIMPPAQIAKELERLSHTPLYSETRSLEQHKADLHEADLIEQLFLQLRNATGLDFSKYKEPTIRRRILRRMVLTNKATMKEYVEYTSTNPSELLELYDDLLIKVTNFFRDPESFDYLKAEIIPAILSKRVANLPIRVWVTGCSSGEEVYSLAIAIVEVMGEGISSADLQIFGTDVSERAISIARKGHYPATIGKVISQERLQRFFSRTETGYRISRPIRDLCIFARQNLIGDPPFSKLDLIMCRNVMIYLSAALQKRVIHTFHHALKDGGYLMLGSSETIGSYTELFNLIEKKCKVYRRKSYKNTRTSIDDKEIAMTKSNSQSLTPMQRPDTLQEQADRTIISLFVPPGVIVDDKLMINQFRGQTWDYLEPSPGMASLNLLKMANKSLRVSLRSAINEARFNNKITQRNGVTFSVNGEKRVVDLSVLPISSPKGIDGFVILFEEPRFKSRSVPDSEGQAITLEAEHPVEFQLLQQELAETQAHLKISVEEHDAYNEELKSANEEIQSSNEELQSTNEELQSTNEELETTKEELQSINEELTTLNEELQSRNVELLQANADLTNLLANVSAAVVVIDSDFHIRRFNPQAEKILNLIPSDIGRPIGDIQTNLRLRSIEELISTFNDPFVPKEVELQDTRGRWYQLSIRPYKSKENKIGGAVISIFDIDSISRRPLKKQNGESEQTLLDFSVLPTALIHPEGKIERTNEAFKQQFKLSGKELSNRSIYDLDPYGLNPEILKLFLKEVESSPVAGGSSQVLSRNLGPFIVAAQRRTTQNPRIIISLMPITENGHL